MVYCVLRIAWKKKNGKQKKDGADKSAPYKK
jgi:hypothetical protein